MDARSIERIRLALRVLCAHYDSSQKITQADIERLKACFGTETTDISLEVMARTVVHRELDREKARCQLIERIEVRTRVANQ